MTIVRYEPWSLVNRLHQSLDQFFGDTLSTPEANTSPSVAWVPRVDIHEEKERFVVLADVPGVDPKDIDITAEGGVLTIRGERRQEKRATENGFERVERVCRQFRSPLHAARRSQHGFHHGEAVPRCARGQHPEAASGAAQAHRHRRELEPIVPAAGR